MKPKAARILLAFGTRERVPFRILLASDLGVGRYGFTSLVSDGGRKAEEYVYSSAAVTRLSRTGF